MVIALGIDTQGRKHVLGLREGATETAAVTTGLLQRPGDARIADGPDVAVCHRRRYGAARGPSPTSSVLAAWCNAAKSISGGTSSAICPSGCTPLSGKALRGCVEPRFGRPCGAGAQAAGRVAGARPPRRGGVHPGGTGRDADRAAPRS